jgi:hypothetical protein
MLTSRMQKQCRTTALRAADWYVNSQVKYGGPQWDANTGRFIYNYHMPTRTCVRGLNWTQGRGIMVLMAAYRLTGESKYRDAAQWAVAYLKALQIYDQTSPNFGALAEEIPQSEHAWPRDVAEGASGFFHLYNETGDKDMVRRARLCGEWLFSTLNKETGFPAFNYFLDGRRPVFGKAAWMVGSGMYFSLIYRATGERKFLAAMKPLLDAVRTDFIDARGNFVCGLAEKGKKRPAVSNDDGLGAALISGALLFKSRRYAEDAVTIGNWMMTQTQRDETVTSLASRLCYLMDLCRFTGDPIYRVYVESRIDEVIEAQVGAKADPLAFGAFRGEDEAVKWYVKGASRNDFVTTRATCYAALALFKLVNNDWTPGYSAFGWKC